MHILVTGVTGLLGEAFFRLLSQSLQHRVTAVTREQMDLADLASVERYLHSTDFDVLINPAGMTGLEQCLDNPSIAHTVNTEAPQLMANICAKKGAKLVHFSTDYVFGGEVNKSLTEDDITNPICEYGVTKLRGETGVLAYQEHLVTRVSWLFGKGRKSVADSVIDKISTQQELAFISDKWSIPTYADDIVRAVLYLLENKYSGLYHVCSSDAPVSWWQYADRVAFLAFELGIVPVRSAVKSTNLNDIAAFRARRPVHTAMSCRKLENAGFRMPSYENSMKVYLESAY